jgi:two-component system nitrate/nitrite response regulator NarL
MTNVNLTINALTSPQTLSTTKAVCICDTQPLIAIGMRTLLTDHGALSVEESVDLLSDGFDFLRENPTGVLLIDKTFGVTAICESIKELCKQGTACASIVVWGAQVSPAEAMLFLHAGARGIFRKTADVSALVACLEAVAKGRVWVEECILRDSRLENFPRNTLTPREEEVLDLVQQGLSNRDIALHLGIRPGTVKIHMKHIFEKTGIRGRHSLELAGFYRNETGPDALKRDLRSVAAA